ncbi:c-type cytochrome [Elongatibacter sediminis]|uniref:C-type cytochrome n=1 Tax=Elongatibacter sediminis TaxID=3119006 RepID=A0AAW9RC10_9GAMM
MYRQDEPSTFAAGRRVFSMVPAFTLLFTLLFALPLPANEAGDGPPEWAVPRAGSPPPHPTDPAKTFTVPGSDLALTQEQIDNPFNAPDWFPDEHAPMPDIVKHGREPGVFACAMCHLASGAGHPQSARLAGQSADYLMRQLQAFGNGDRNSYLGDFIDNLHTLESDQDAREAAQWFAALTPQRHQQVIETDTVPMTTFYGNTFMRVVDEEAAGSEPLDGRIIEVPEDYRAVENRSPRGHFLTYVPPGSLERGRQIAEGGSGLAPCASCHGADLRGTALGPSLAGSFPTYLIRQLYDFRSGKRRGIADQTGYMGTSSKMLSEQDIVDVAAYLGSLEP